MEENGPFVLKQSTLPCEDAGREQQVQGGVRGSICVGGESTLWPVMEVQVNLLKPGRVVRHSAEFSVLPHIPPI